MMHSVPMILLAHPATATPCQLAYLPISDGRWGLYL